MSNAKVERENGFYFWKGIDDETWTVVEVEDGTMLFTGSGKRYPLGGMATKGLWGAKLEPQVARAWEDDLVGQYASLLEQLEQHEAEKSPFLPPKKAWAWAEEDGKWEHATLSDCGEHFHANGETSFPIRPQYDFVVDRVSFKGCPPGTLVKYIFFGDHKLFQHPRGVPVEAWHDLYPEEAAKLHGYKIRGGLDIQIGLVDGPRPFRPSGYTMSIPWLELRWRKSRRLKGLPVPVIIESTREVPVGYVWPDEPKRWVGVTFSGRKPKVLV